jgi:hypothetical protein
VSWRDGGLTREFKLEAVRLIRDRGASYAWLTRPRSQRSRSDEEADAKGAASENLSLLKNISLGKLVHQ